MTPLRHLTGWQRLVVAATLGVIVGMLVALFVWTLISNNDRIGEIQQSRVNSTLASCYAQDHRHEVLYVELEAVAEHQRRFEPAKYRETVVKARELEELLNALQPEENCEQRTKKLVEENQRQGRPAKPLQLRSPGPLRLTG